MSALIQTAPVNIEHVLAYAAGPTITGIFTIVLAWLNKRSNVRSEKKLHSIDQAVNGNLPGEPTIGQNVKSLVGRPRPEI
jgi:hypothetical protein